MMQNGKSEEKEQTVDEKIENLILEAWAREDSTS